VNISYGAVQKFTLLPRLLIVGARQSVPVNGGLRRCV